MSSVEHQIESVRRTVGKSDPWLSGTIQVPIDTLDLFYLDKSDPPQSQHLKLTKTSSLNDLEKLSTSCDKATFGRAKEDVLDESYRKAGKMELDRFASKLDSHVNRLVPKIVPHLLNGKDSEREVEAELYKLNVYDTGGFFRIHKDTPRSKWMFGSLVIVFPTTHTGGELVLRHDRKELTFDSGDVLSNSIENSIAYVAFFSDIEHEVLPVTSGYRITLTYNLYFTEPSTGSDLLPPNTKRVSELKKTLSALLDNPDFCPKGGLLGFALSHSYPVNIKEGGNLSDILRVLKGEDAVIRSACEDLELSISIKSVLEDEHRRYNSWNGSQILLDHALDLSHYGEKEYSSSWIHVVVRRFGTEGDTAILVHPYNEKPARRGYSDGQDISMPLAWITDPKDGLAGYTSSYFAYGNETTMDFEYIRLSLVVAFGPVEDRANWWEYRGELVP